MTRLRFITLSIVAFLVTLAAVCAIACPKAQAYPYDPHIPIPPIWCPGNAPGLSSSGYGAYCEGTSYGDGSRWNVYRLGYFWQPMRCIYPDGTAFPPLAPNGCGQVLG